MFYFIGLRERETSICCSTYFLGWFLRVPTGLNLQLGVRGWRPNQQSHRVTGFNAPPSTQSHSCLLRRTAPPAPGTQFLWLHRSRLLWSDL